MLTNKIQITDIEGALLANCIFLARSIIDLQSNGMVFALNLPPSWRGIGRIA